MPSKTMREHFNDRFDGKANFVDNPPLPDSLNIELNSGCNQACEFCPFHGRYALNHPPIATMKYEDAISILDQAKKLGIGRKEVGFYLSGEAFLHKDLSRIIKYAKELGFKYTFITSNGALADEEKMKGVLDAGLDSIRFSINADNRELYEEIHGRDDFDKVVDNVRFTHEYITNNHLPVSTSISCVLTKRTQGIKTNIRDLFSEYVDDIIFIPLSLLRLNCDDEYRQENQMFDERMLSVDKSKVCPMLFNTMYIGANMTVMPCCEAYDDNAVFYDLNKDFNLENAWYSDAYRYHRGIFLHGNDDSNTICHRCYIRIAKISDIYVE